jgi:hypothetical protein
MTTNYTKLPENIPNGREIFQMVIKTIFSMPWPSKIYPNWDFWLETEPSGNPTSEGSF